MDGGKPEAHDPLESVDIPTEPPAPDPRTDKQRRRNTSNNSKNHLTTRSYPNCAPISDAGLKTVAKDNSSSPLIQKKDQAQWYSFAEKKRCLKTIRELEQEAGFVGIRGIGQVLDVKVCHHQDRYGIEILIESLFRDGTASWIRIVNGIDKYVTETTETVPFDSADQRATGRPVAKARPRLK